MAATAEKTFRDKLQLDRLRGARSREQKISQSSTEPRSVTQKLEDKGRTAVAAGTKYALIGTGAGAPVGLIAERLLQNRIIFRWVVVGCLLIGIMALSLFVAMFTAVAYVLSWFGL